MLKGVVARKNEFAIMASIGTTKKQIRKILTLSLIHIYPDTPIDMEAFKRGETAIAGKDTEYNAPNTALVGETLTLTADSTW